MVNFCSRFFFIIVLTSVSNISASQDIVAEALLRPIDVIHLHMGWINGTKNYLVKIENYDLSGMLEGTTEMFVDYEAALNVRRYTPVFAKKSIKTFSRPNYHETRIDGYGYFQSHGKSLFDPFGDGRQDLFVQGKSSQSIMKRLEKIATQIRAIKGSGERIGMHALCFRYNDYFVDEYKKDLFRTWNNSDDRREHELQILCEFGEQQYWFNDTSGELLEYVVLRKTQFDTVPVESDVLFFRKFSVKDRNVSYESSRKIIQSLFGKREGKQFDSREELLRDYQINAFIAERSYVRYFILIAANLGFILLYLLIRGYYSKKQGD